MVYVRLMHVLQHKSPSTEVDRLNRMGTPCSQPATHFNGE